MTAITFQRGLEALEIYGTVTTFVDRLSPTDFLAPTRCRGWTVGDLLFHLTCDAQRALVTFSTPATVPPDVDFATYWAPFQPLATDEHDVAETRWLRVSASALSASGMTELWDDTSSAAVRAAARIDPAEALSTQGHSLTPADFLATLVVEATIHYLDLTVEFDAAIPPPASALDVVRHTLDARLGQPLRADWDDVTYALKATGRTPIVDDLAVLGDQARLLPLLG
ncbi:MAG: maleylpyruvate isomerase N-terminal domain-containing protein [Ilumatobacteraceae bacterium]